MVNDEVYGDGIGEHFYLNRNRGSVISEKIGEGLILEEKFVESYSIVKDPKSQLLGLISKDSIILPCEYRLLWLLKKISDDLFLLEGLHDEDDWGKYLLKRFNHTETIEKLENVDQICIGQQGCVAYSSKGKWTFVAKDGKKSSKEYDEIAMTRWRYSDDLYNFEFPIKVKIGDLYSFIDEKGNQLTSTLYSYATNFKDGIALVKTGPRAEDRKLIDITGKETEILTSGFVHNISLNKDVPVQGFVIEEFYGFFDISSRKVIIPCIYERTPCNLREEVPFLYGPAGVSKEGKWGYINTKGEAVMPFIYENGDCFSKEGLAIVQKEGKWGYINTKGETVVPFIYENVDCFSKEGFATVKKEGKWGCVNTKGETVIPFKFDDKVIFKDGFAIVKSMKKVGVINTKSEVVIPFQYEYIGSFAWELAVVKIFGKGHLGLGVVDKYGKVLIQPNYSNICINQHTIDASITYYSGNRDSDRTSTITTIYNLSGEVIERTEKR